jgi:type IV pilus assembly protein PilN
LHAFHQKAEVARATEQSVQSKIDAINRERQGYQEMMRQPDNDALLKQVGSLNQLIDEKTFSWTLAMEDLETVLPGGVQATTLEPVRDPKTNIITLKLRVVGPRDRAVDLVENLEHSKHFLLPTIVGESTESTSGPGEKLEAPSASNRVNFELLAQYNPAAPVDRKAQQKAEKPSADGEHESHSAPPPHAALPLARPVAAEHASQSAPPPHPALPPATPAVHAEQPGRLHINDPGRFGHHGNHHPNADLPAHLALRRFYCAVGRGHRPLHPFRPGLVRHQQQLQRRAGR